VYIDTFPSFKEVNFSFFLVKVLKRWREELSGTDEAYLSLALPALRCGKGMYMFCENGIKGKQNTYIPSPHGCAERVRERRVGERVKPLGQTYPNLW